MSLTPATRTERDTFGPIEVPADRLMHPVDKAAKEVDGRASND